MRKEIKKRSSVKKVNRTTKIKIVIAAAACLLVAGVSFTVYSKYYKTGYNPGMATASGFYFSSNYMAASTEIMGKSMEVIARDYQDNVLVSTNESSWNGTDAYTFPIYVRNYDNQLLYNDKDLNVEYEVSFMLIDYPTGATYTIKKAGDEQAQSLGWTGGKGEIRTFRGTLAGGKPIYDTYELSVSLLTTVQDVYTPARVLMVARPTGPSFLANTKWIAGILKADYEEKEFRIEKSGFAISMQEDKWTETGWDAEVEKEAGYVYQLYTTGSYTGGGTQKTLLVKWRSDLFKINYFDPYYQKVKDDPSRYYQDPDDSKWQVMKIDIQPYASLKFVFYRTGSNFMNTVKTLGQEGFENSVVVELVNN